MTYVGRFAPSPTGPLHLGTLTAAVASYLHARQAGGEWLVRIEDIDPPREVAGSADSIIATLANLGLEWDRSVTYQSARLDFYRAGVLDLLSSQKAYYCDCSRQRIRKTSGGNRYPGTCRQRQLPPGDKAIRLRAPRHPISFRDGVMGQVERDIEATDGDFIVFRRDELPAYHLAVVLDDADQGVTDVVRGADLLDCTPLHIHLQHVLSLPTPGYWHTPLVLDAAGEKLSKGSGATAIDASRPLQAVSDALAHLGLQLPAELNGAPPETLWQWAAERWEIRQLATAQAPTRD